MRLLLKPLLYLLLTSSVGCLVAGAAWIIAYTLVDYTPAVAHPEALGPVLGVWGILGTLVVATMLTELPDQKGGK